MFYKLMEHLKVIFEGNRCRFRKECMHYQIDSAVCNNLLKRFPTYDKAYCGTYRKLETGWREDEGGYIVPKIWIEARKISTDSITIADKGKQ